MTLSQTSLPVLLTRLDGIQVGFAAAAVREIVRAVAIEPLPGAPGMIEGVINLHGRIVPVVDLRQRLALPALALAPDQFMVALQSLDRLVAVRVDDVEDMTEIPEGSLQSQASISPVLRRLRGVSAIASGALVVHDVDAFLTQTESEELDLAELQNG
jgi:purine-binding chemotaxis protein CheW